MERGGLQFDPTRIFAQIVAGVGFLGAGAIIRRGGDVRGLTTAASLWATAAIGMAVSAGYLFGAAATTVLAMATLYALRSFCSSVIYPLRLDAAGLEISLKEPASGPQDALEVLRRHDISVRTIDVEIDEEHARYKLQVRIPHPTTSTPPSPSSQASPRSPASPSPACEASSREGGPGFCTPALPKPALPVT